MQVEIDDADEALADDILEHFGVKGMRWGIRRELERQQKETRKADKKWTKRADTKKGWVLDYNSMVDDMNNGEIDRINNDPRFRNADVKSPGPIRDEYQQEISNTILRLLNQASQDRVGSSPSGTLHVRWQMPDPDDLVGYPSLHIVDNQVRHADDSPDGEMAETVYTIDVEWDPDWHILSVAPSADDREIAQSAIDLAMDMYETNQLDAQRILMHYGVLGMRWGVRRDRRYRRDLSDEDLRRTIERMRLEKQYDEIANPPSATRKFVAKHGDRVFGTAVAAVASFAVKRYLDKRFGNGAGAATKNVADTIGSYNPRDLVPRPGG